MSRARQRPRRSRVKAQPAPVQNVAPDSAARSVSLPLRFHFSVPGYVALGLFAAWALAALALLVRLGISLYRLERLKTDALPLPIDYRERLAKWAAADKGGREVRLCICDQIEVPVAVGLFDSMILIPQHLLDTLSQDEIDQIMLHELAHLRRADDWTNGVQRLIQALFFFNPAMLFIAQQLDLEREVACDDWVVRQTSSVRPYASCLTKMAEVTAWPHRAMAAPGVFVTRRGLSVRVERLLRAGRDIRTSISFGPAGTVVAAFVVLFFVLQTVAPSFAFTQEDVVIPAQHVQVPAETIKLPARDVTTAKGRRVHVAAQTIHVGGSTLDIPPQHLHVARQVSQVSPPEVTIPGRRYSSHSSSRTTYVEVPNPNVRVNVPADLGVNAANVGMEAASQGLRQAAQALQHRGDSPAAWRSYSQAYSRAFSHAFSNAYAHSEAQGFNCVGCDYTNQNLAGKSFRGQRFNGADFSHDDLHGADFTGAVLTGVDFSDTNLRGVSFRGAKMTGCDLSHADITNASFDGADVTGCDVDARSLAPDQAGQWLRTCRNGCDFKGANLRGQDLHGLDLTGVDLSSADLTGANLENAKLSGVDFSDAKLDDAKLSGAEFVGCDFSRVNLGNVDMSNARFTGDKFDDSSR